MYDSVPTQLATDKRSYVISSATGKKKIDKDLERLHDLLDSKTVLACYNALNPSVALSQTRDDDTFKLYLTDTGLFTTMIFKSSGKTDENIYTKLLSDSLPADLESITEFQKKYSKHVVKEILLSQKDIGNTEMLKLYPIYMLPFIVEEL